MKISFNNIKYTLIKISIFLTITTLISSCIPYNDNEFRIENHEYNYKEIFSDDNIKIIYKCFENRYYGDIGVLDYTGNKLEIIQLNYSHIYYDEDITINKYSNEFENSFFERNGIIPFEHRHNFQFSNPKKKYTNDIVVNINLDYKIKNEIKNYNTRFDIVCKRKSKVFVFGLSKWPWN